MNRRKAILGLLAIPALPLVEKEPKAVVGTFPSKPSENVEILYGSQWMRPDSILNDHLHMGGGIYRINCCITWSSEE